MTKFSVKKPLTVFVAIILVLVFGAVSFSDMTPDLFPSLDLPYVLLMTTYPGATPEAVETAVSKPLEQSMATIENINNIRSKSAANYSMLMLEFADGTNMDTASIDIREKIDMVSAYMPDGVGSTVIMKINPNVLPVASYAVDMDGKNTQEVSDFVKENVINRLEGVSGIASVNSMGLLEQRINVVISQDKLDKVNKKIEDALNKKFKEAEDKIADGKNQLQEGIDKATDGKAQIENGKKELNDKREEIANQLAQGKATLDSEQTKLLETKLELVNKQSELTTQREFMKKAYDALVLLQKRITELKETESILTATKEKLEQIKTKYDDALAQLKDAAQGSELYQAAKEKLRELDKQLSELSVTYNEISERIEKINEALEKIKEGYEKAKEDISALGAKIEELPEAVKGLEEVIGQLDSGIEKIATALTQLEEGKLKIDEAKKQLEIQKSAADFQMNSTYAELVTKESEVTATISQLEKTKAELEKSVDDLAEKKQEALDNANAEKVITMDMVSNILKAQNFSMPAGYITDDNVDYLVRVGDKVADVVELSNMMLFDMNIDGLSPIFLSDVADVFETDNSDEVFAKINGNNGVMLSFTKQSNYATAEASNNLQSELKELSEENEGLHFTSLMDQGDYIYLVINNVLQNLLLGAALAVIILFIFLRDIKPTIIIAFSIPISLIAAIILMYFSGITLNVISLSGLAVGVGMLVDNSVVVIENIFRLRSKGVPALQAAASGAKQVAGAIASSTLTTVCVFLPIVFVKGLTRQIFTDMALTITFSLLASLVIALSLVPAMSSKMFVNHKEKQHKIFDKLVAVYEKALRFVLGHRAIALITAVILLAGSALGATSRGFSFMPDVAGTELTITAEMPKKNTFEETTQTADKILERLYKFDEFETVGGMIGSQTALIGLGGVSSDTSEVSFYAVLDKSKTINTENLVRSVEEALQDLDAEITVSGGGAMDSMSLLTGSGIALKVYCDDLTQLQKSAEDIAKIISKVDGVQNVESGIEDTTPEISISVDKQKAMKKGLTVAQVYQQISAEIASEKTATSLTNSDSSSLDVVVVSGKNEDYNVDRIKNIQLTYTEKDGETSQEKKVALSEIAQINEGTTLSSIGRYNQNRYLSVSAEVADGYITTNVANDVQKAVEGYNKPSGVTIESGGENENTMQAVFEMVKMLGLAVVFIYLIMVAQFQSLKSPFIVMFTIPLAFTGGFLGLFITGFNISIVSLVGFIMLCGVIVNNGIVLVDYINQLRLDGSAKKDAIIEAGKTRIRPILMTSLTTILGLSTMALGIGSGSQLMQPLAIVCIGGLLYATVMTLFIVPVLYDLFNRKEMKKISDSDVADIDE